MNHVECNVSLGGTISTIMRSRPSLITRLDIKSGNLITVRSTGGRNIAGVYGCQY